MQSITVVKICIPINAIVVLVHGIDYMQRYELSTVQQVEFKVFKRINFSNNMLTLLSTP